MPYVPPVDWKDQDPTTALTAGRMKAMEAALAAWSDTKVPQTLVDAKGDLLVGSSADTVARLPVGTNDYQLQTSSTTSSGLAWVRKSMVNAGDPTYSLPTNGTSNAATAINTAGAVAAFGGGGICKVPPGNYTLTAPIHHNFNSRVFWDLRGCRFTISGANTIGLQFNPGALGDDGVGGGAIGGHFICGAASQVGVKFRNANNFTLEQTRIENGNGILVSNDGGGQYNENHTIQQVYIAPGTTGYGIKWESINSGDASMEGQNWYDVHVFGGLTCWDLGPNLNYENVDMVGCRVMAAGVPGATMIRTRGDLEGWRVAASAEHLNSAAFGGTANPNCVIFNTDAGTINNNLADIRLHILPQTTGANNNATWAAAPFVKDASVVQPTIIRDGPVHMMGAVLGGYLMRARRDFEATDRFRLSYSGIETGPGGGTAVDTQLLRAGVGQWTAGTGKITIGDGTAATDTTAVRQVVGQVNFGSTTTTARPSGFTTVQWIGGPGEPVNAVNGDTWIDTS